MAGRLVGGMERRIRAMKAQAEKKKDDKKPAKKAKDATASGRRS